LSCRIIPLGCKYSPQNQSAFFLCDIHIASVVGPCVYKLLESLTKPAWKT
jgi:hypothetical protein